MKTKEKEALKIIDYVNENIKPMLRSVYNFNSKFRLEKKQKSLLNKILFAMFLANRKFFTDNSSESYADTALSIGEGQTISQPSTVARMLLLSKLEISDSVLEVGSGSGWNAALIGFLVYPGNVKSVERIQVLKEKAEKNLNKLRTYLKQENPGEYEKFSKINFENKNVFHEKRKFDKIIITAGISQEDKEKIKDLANLLLKKNGILICPYILGPILLYKKNKKPSIKETKEEYAFVPLLKGIEK